MKNLVVYFSRTGENWFGGGLKNISKGNTEIVAETIANAVGADIKRVEAVHDYPNGYYACCDAAKKELEAGARPKLKSEVSVEGYDNIFIGYPIWWGTMPMPMFSALEGQDYKNKNVIPFATHEGSGLAHSEGDVRKVCKGANVKKGRAFVGSSVSSLKAEIESWAREAIK